MIEYWITGVLLVPATIVVIVSLRRARRWKDLHTNQHAFTRLLAQDSAGLLVVSDREGTILETSKSFRARFGQLLGNKTHPGTVHDIMGEKSCYDYKNILKYIFRENQSVHEFRVTVASDGRSGELLMSVTPVVAEDGRGIGLIHEFVNPDKLTQANADFELLEKLTNMGRIASGIAHELNTPLGSIILSADIITEMGGAGQIRQEAHKIKNQAVHCSRVVKELLHYVKKDENIKRRVGIGAIIEQVRSLVSTELTTRSITLDVRMRTEKDSILCDENQMEQLLFNLFSNALHAIKDDGRITITVNQDSLLNQLVVVFEDDGSGIAPEIMAQIFDPFFTTKPGSKGTGLGLALCQRIVHEHNGTIDVRSVPDQGAAFTLRFPVAS